MKYKVNKRKMCKMKRQNIKNEYLMPVNVIVFKHSSPEFPLCFQSIMMQFFPVDSLMRVSLINKLD